MIRRASPVVVAMLFALMLPAAAQDKALDAGQQAVHVLNRLAFGPRPGDVERVQRIGVRRYIDEQLHPESIPMPPDLEARLAGLQTVNRSAGESLDEFLELRKEVRTEDEGAQQRRRQQQALVAREAAEARLLRAIDSPRQLEEVMVDFWFNHFNVFSGKGIVRALAGSYERDAIRPYALGSFRALLGATAHHPAMLFYLDNAVSSTPRPNAKGQGRRPERKLCARADGAAYPGRRRRLYPARRDRTGAHADRLDLRPAPPGARWRNLPLRPAPP
jgi:hypothetical protein